MEVNFLQIATEAVARGFAIIPLQPNAKDPDFRLVGRKDGEIGTGGAARRTQDPAQILEWAAASPHANLGVCSDERVTILESDNIDQFRQLVRDITLEKYGIARELPSTLTSQARAGRPHFFYLNSAYSSEVTASPAIEGLFEWRHKNQYVVGPGSVHPTGAVYQIVNDVPMVEMPKWLVDTLMEIRDAFRGESNNASNYILPGPAIEVRDALLQKYELDPQRLLADESFEVHVTAGQRHYFLLAIAGLLHDGERTEYELAELLKEFRDRFCESGKGDYEVENLARWATSQEPCTVEPTLAPDGRVQLRETPAPQKAIQAPKKADPNDYLVFAYPAVEGNVKEYVLEPKTSKFDGWFPRGRPSLVAGSSGAGKSTLMLDLLRRQQGRTFFLGHRGAGLRWLTIFADRGRLANAETLERMGLSEDDVNIGYIAPVWGPKAVVEIVKQIENYEAAELPQAVFVEGGDMLVEEANKKRDVADFMSGLQAVAEYYHIAIILSLGSAKTNKQNAPVARRDAVYGSEQWSRSADTTAIITTEGDGTGDLRKLTVQHRNAASESFMLRFDNGLLVEVPAEEVESDQILSWIKEQPGEFTATDAWEDAFKESGLYKRAAFFDRIKALRAEGVLSVRREGKNHYLKLARVQ